MNATSASLSTKSRQLVVIVAITALLVALVSAIASADHGDFDFEIDGDLVPATGTDWTDVITDDDYTGPAPDPTLAWDDGPGILLLDHVGNPDQTLFKPAGKFSVPAEWQINSGSPGPSQNDLTNTYVYPVTSPGLHENHDATFNNDLYLVMGMERLKKEGTFDLDFEFNQQAWDGSSGTLVRTVGDFVAAYELSGNPTGAEDLQVKLMVYDPTQSLELTCSVVGDFIERTDDAGAPGFGLCPIDEFGSSNSGFVIVYFGAAGALGDLGEAEMNVPTVAAGPWGSYNTKGDVVNTIPPFEFAEATINLSEIGIEPACPGFGSVHAKSRSSLESTSDLKDLAGPSSLEVSCALTARKYHDLNANGDQDEGEPFLPNWDMNLYLDNTEAGTAGVLDAEDTLLDTIATDDNGEAVFSGLSDGTYHLEEVCPDDWIQSEPTADSATAADCGTGTYENIVVNAENPNAASPYDFGNYQNITKSGTKYEDSNADGDRDEGEPGLAGWTITAYTPDGEGNADAFVDDTTTAGDGSYTLSLTPGAYVICETQQSGYNQSAPADGPECPDGTVGYAIDLASGEFETGNDFGNYQNGTKSGLKWEDRNTDGVQDLGEPKLDGWTINVYADDGDGVLSQDEIDAGPVATTDTADGTGSLGLGEYSFSLEPGSYVACEVLQSGWEQTFPTTGPECPGHTAESPNLGYGFTLTSGEDHVDNDFGNVTRGDVSGTKYKDSDDDGSTAGESGLEGWTINLYEDDGSGDAGTFLATTDTDVNGDYEFADLLPGDYVVCEAADFDGNDNWVQTFPDSGAGCSTGDAANGHAVTIAGGDSKTGDFANAPLSDITVDFDDLTGYTSSAISCVDGDGAPIGDGADSTGGSAGAPGVGNATEMLDDVRVADSAIVCTITVVDP